MYCLVQTPGGREALELCELQDPAPNNREVPVRVHTAGALPVLIMSTSTIARENRRHRCHSFQESKERAMLKPSEKACRISPSLMR